MRTRLTSRITAVTLAGALLTGGFVALAPAATADSRCSTASHTHGALWWKRTDNFLGRRASMTPGKTEYQHTNSNPVNC